MFDKFSRMVAIVNRRLTNVAGFGLLMMTGLVMTDVILRRLLNAPLIFADEVGGYLLVLVTMFGLGYTLKEDAHIQVKIIVDQVSPRKLIHLRIVWCATSIAYAAVLLVLTAELAWESFELKAFSPTPSQLTLYPFQLVMPVGCLLLLLQLIVDLVNAVCALSSPDHVGPQNEDKPV